MAEKVYYVHFTLYYIFFDVFFQSLDYCGLEKKKLVVSCIVKLDYVNLDLSKA